MRGKLIMVDKNMVKSKKIFRFEDKKINFEVEGFLSVLEVEEAVYVANHAQFHPFRTYRHSLRQAIRPIEKMVDLFISCIKTEFGNYNNNMEESLIELIENALHNLISHVDTCKNIMKQLNVDNKIQSNFLSNIEPYRSLFALQINLVKHNSRFVRIIRGVDENKKDNLIIGYYIEGKHELLNSEGSKKGVVGPDPKVHKLYKGRATAFSLNKHLRLMIWFLLYISHNLYNSIKSIESLSLTRIPKKHKEFTDIYLLVKKIMRIPQCYFPDEMNIAESDAPYIRELKNQIHIGNVISEWSSDLISLPSFRIIGLQIRLDNENTFLIPYLMK